jgi:hypothetical protein
MAGSGVGGSNPLSPTNIFNCLQTSAQDRPGISPGVLARLPLFAAYFSKDPIFLTRS